MNGLSAVERAQLLQRPSPHERPVSSFNGLMTTSAGRKTVSYLVKCALASNDSLVKADQNGTNYTFAGGIGLCPAWKNGGVSGNGQCMEGISACMMAHVNTSGVHVPLWLDSNDPAIGWGIDRVNYPMQEGTFFGDIIDTGPLTNIGKPSVPPRRLLLRRCRLPRWRLRRRRRPPRRQPERRALHQPVRQRHALPEPSPRRSVNVQHRASRAAAPPARTPTPARAAPTATRQLTTRYGGVPGTTASPCGATTATRRCSTPATSTRCRPPSPSGSPMVMDSGTSPIQQWNQSAGLATSVFTMAPSGSSWTISPIDQLGQVPRRGRRHQRHRPRRSTPATAAPRRTGTSPRSRRTAASTSPRPAPVAA